MKNFLFRPQRPKSDVTIGEYVLVAVFGLLFLRVGLKILVGKYFEF
jgi:hypothetical protein